ncbi:MAG: S8 family serine peptidase, partial [Acidimicrobiia bacterium]
MSPFPALLVMFAIAATTAPEPPETVKVVVPADSVVVLDQADSLEQAEGGPKEQWVTVEVPVEGTVEHTLDAVSEEVGEPVFEEAFLEQFDPIDEPLFPEQWHHHNVGQGGGSADADIDTPTAWRRSTGLPIVVAVIDSGVERNHPDLVGRILAQGVDFVDGDDDPSPGSTSSDDAHGTMVSGVIAAPENDVGTTGVAPDARIMAVRACSNGSCSTADVANGIIWAV